MNDDLFLDWYNDYFDDNAILYAEKHEDDFWDFCMQRFSQLGVDKDE